MSKPHAPIAIGNRHKVLAAICVSAIIIPLVFTGPAISTLAVGRDLGGDQSSLSWIVNAYAIAFGGCVMAAGAIGDQIGRKRCFVAGLWIFIATSFLIGLTPDLLLLNLLRAIEGIGGALVLTSATSLLAQEFEGAERTRAFSFLGTAFGVGLAFGPMASGFLIEHLGWRSLYFAIALIALLILLLGTRRIRESSDPDAQGIDWPGTVLFTAALVSLTFGIVRGPQDGWASLRVLSLLGGTALLLGAFVAVELRRPRPMLELSLFRYPRFIGVQLLPVATGFSFVALIVYLPIWFMVIQGRDAFTAGLAILPLTAPMLVVPLLAGRMAQHVSPGLLSGIGFLISALGASLLMHLSPEGSLWAMTIPMLLIGIGNGLPWGLMDALSVSVVPKERAGMAAGIFTTMRVAGEAIAIAAIGAVLVGLTATNLRAAATTASLSLPQSATVIASQIGASAEHRSTAGPVSTIDGAVIELTHHAYTSAFHGIFGVLAVLSAITAVVCIVTLRHTADERSTAHEGGRK
ncbi:MFS transporter [Pseudomonas saponiphila]|uniref:MFS transporter n=1 Tax=Serratia liquefaciens TaxID=614 RepID=UPI0021C77E7B|nr:MFS transporter [Serratia liquefaciens]